jgi:hypothetical protein
MNGVLCYFPQYAILQDNVQVFGRKIDKTKIEVKLGVEHFLANAFQKFYIIIWSCMKVKDVLKVLPMLMLEKFMDKFMFIRGCEQYSKTFGEIYLGSYYYLKDLKHVYYVCCGLPYGKENQTLLIDNEPNKALQNAKWSGLFVESFRVSCCQKKRCNPWTWNLICG